MPEQPALVILSASLDMPLQTLCEEMERAVYVATGDKQNNEALAKIRSTGARALDVGSGSRKVDGKKLVAALASEGFSSIYSIAGPGVLETLVNAHVLDRLYLTHVHRLIGGESFNTLLEGEHIDPPAGFNMQAHYYDQHAGDVGAQLFGVYDTLRETD